MLMHTIHPATAPRRSPGWPIAAALVIASLACAACAGDDDGSASTTDLAAFCAKAAETNQPGTLPTPELLAEYQALAPDEIADPVAVLVEAFAAGDDPAAAFSDPDVVAAIEQITEFESEQCGLEPPQPGAADGPDAESTTTDSAADGTSAELSEEAFVEQANAICAAGNVEIEALAAETFGSGTPPTDEQLLDLLDQVLANVNAQIEAIDALAPPVELATAVDEWLSAGRSGLEAARAQGTAFFDPTGENPVSAEANRLATGLGVTECA
jgi:hypothetical protein